MNILKVLDNFIEMDLFNLAHELREGKLLRIELGKWSDMYVCYTGNISIKKLSKELKIDNLRKEHIIKN